MAQTFATYMTKFSGSQTTTPGVAGYYRLLNTTTDSDNCFAYAVGKPGRINSQTRAQLTDAYEEMHFYEIDMATPRQAGDAEVYAKPTALNQIVHAHRVNNATTATSKLGGGELIQHHIDTLQAPKVAGGNTYEYGVIIMRFRRDDDRWNKRWTTTKSGRLVRKREEADDPAASKKSKPAPAAGKPAPAASKTPATKTSAPVTKAPVTKAPVTKAPVTKAPVTKAPVTKAPVTKAPAVKAPVKGKK